MAYVPPDYPAAIPSYAEVWPWADDVDDVNVAAFDAIVKELRAALIELGVNPSGGEATVTAAIAAVRALEHTQGTDTALGAQAEALDMNTHLINNVVDPVGAQDAATKKYIDDDPLTHFHDRGDPASYDFDVGDLTTDGTFRELDLSGIAPAGTTSVLLFVLVKDDVIDSNIQFRKAGSANAVSRGALRTQVANNYLTADIICPVDSNRKIEYNAKNLVWTNIIIVVKGWWL